MKSLSKPESPSLADELVIANAEILRLQSLIPDSDAMTKYHAISGRVRQLQADNAMLTKQIAQLRKRITG